MQTTDIQISGMDCADCARTLEQGVARLAGVSACDVSLSSARMRVTFDPAATGREAITARVEALGYRVDTPSAAQPAGQAASPGDTNLAQAARSFARFLATDRATQPALIGAGLLAIGLLLELGLAIHTPAEIIFVLAMLIAGIPLARDAIRSAILSRRITIGLLMTIAAVGALLIGEPGEGAAVVILFAIGEALESFTMQRARDSFTSLMRLAPAEAMVLSPCMDCSSHLGRDGYTGGACPWCAPHSERRPVAEVEPGATILVRPGERVPLDGIVTAGESAVSQQHITGESLPVARSQGDEIYAGSVNGDGAIELRVSRPASDSLLSRIAALVEQAQSQRAPLERFIDRFAAIYTPAVVVAALAVAVIPALFGQPFWNQPDGTQGWLYRALALLVVACPCALVISTPVSIVSALSAATRAGILVRGGAALEALRKVRVAAFDKTGTLTQGHPEVTQVRCVEHPAAAASCDGCDNLLALAAAVEARSAHPLAGAILRAAEQRQLAARYAADAVVALPGRGIEAQVGGSAVAIGSHSYFDASHQHSAALCAEVRDIEAAGRTVMMVCSCDQGGVQGYIALADQVRPESRAAVAALRGAGIEHTVMLTGDNQAVGEAVAQAAGVDEARCGLLPDQKLAAVRELTALYGGVAMIGDGANDTPALAAATVGIAMGAAGSDQALATADIALMRDDLSRLPFLLRLSRRAAATVRWNIALSLGAKLAFLGLALAGISTLWLAVAADSGIALLVTLNGMRLLRERPES